MHPTSPRLLTQTGNAVYWGEIFELFMGPKSWVDLRVTPLQPGQLGRLASAGWGWVSQLFFKITGEWCPFSVGYIIYSIYRTDLVDSPKALNFLENLKSYRSIYTSSANNQPQLRVNGVYNLLPLELNLNCFLCAQMRSIFVRIII